MRAVEHEQRLREAADAALRIGRWRSTSKAQLLRMLEFALREPERPSCSCTDPDAGKFNRNCPVHGIVAEEAATIEVEADSTEELKAEARAPARPYCSHPSACHE